MRFRGGPVLGIESSCDETSAAIVSDRSVLGHVILSQDAHAVFGGVVPEIAARQHLVHIDEVVAQALDEACIRPAELTGVGVTAGPGLVGALLVGLNWAKGFGYALSIPVIGVHHMEAHLFANSLESHDATPPFVALLISGGHTLLLHAPAWGRYELLGSTRDDAVGEAFDKVARRIGLGFPGGPEIERMARKGVAGTYSLPRPMLSARDAPGDPAWFDFSFSGLKTAASHLMAAIEKGDEKDIDTARPHVAAEFQEAVIEVLTARNGPLRERRAACLEPDGRLFAPPPRLSTDNAAMVARLAEHRLAGGEVDGLDLNADPRLPFPGLFSSTPDRSEAC